MALRTLLMLFVCGMVQSLVCLCRSLRFCGAYCFLKKDVFVCLMMGGSCSLGILCTDFYLLVKIFGREGLLYGFIVVTLLENNMALVGPINYYL